MGLRFIKAAASLELSDDAHLARLILLLDACSGKSGNKPVEGIMKLAKLDFLLRYPNCLERALAAEGKKAQKANIAEYERTTIESKMIRYKYGPWDLRYRRWLGILIAKSLAESYLDGRTVMIRLTDNGRLAAKELLGKPEFEVLRQRSKLICSAFGSKSATYLKEFIYRVFPEIASMKWGEDIKI